MGGVGAATLALVTDDAARRAVPWIRLAGAIALVLCIVDVASSVWVGRLLTRVMHDPLAIEAAFEAGIDPFEGQERDRLLLDAIGLAGLGITIAWGWSIAVTLCMVARHSLRLRLPAGLAALGLLMSTVSSLAVLAEHFRDGPDAFAGLTGWYQAAAIGCAVAWGALLALVLVHTRERPRRGLALACMVVGATWTLVHLYGTFIVSRESPPSWWFEPVLGPTVATWLSLVGSLGLSLGVWLAAAPTPNDAPRFDALAAAGLRTARAALWWRVGLAVGAVVLSIAGLMAVQRANRSAFLGGGSSTPWTLKLAPWIGYVEVVLGVLMVLGLLAAVLQRRSAVAAALAGVGSVLLVAATMGSFALNARLHVAVHQASSSHGGFGGSELRRYAELTAEIDPTLRWLGLAGMVLVLAGLVVLARRVGLATPTRAYRFLALAALFTLAWLYGREALAELGTGVLLLAPVALGAAIWMLLDLTTFLGEVAQRLDGDLPSSS